MRSGRQINPLICLITLIHAGKIMSMGHLCRRRPCHWNLLWEHICCVWGLVSQNIYQMIPVIWLIFEKLKINSLTICENCFGKEFGETITISCLLVSVEKEYNGIRKKKDIRRNKANECLLGNKKK